jgi:hypothetical protein
VSESEDPLAPGHLRPFGPSTPPHMEAVRVPIPVGVTCFLCSKPVRANDSGVWTAFGAVPEAYGGPTDDGSAFDPWACPEAFVPWHRDCFLWSIFGDGPDPRPKRRETDPCVH